MKSLKWIILAYLLFVPSTQTWASNQDQQPTPEERTVIVTGCVTDADGAPIAGATVWWQGPTPSGVDASSGSPTITNLEGRFRVPVIVSEPDATSKERYLVGTGFDVFADGYIRFQERLRVEERVVESPERELERNFALMLGEEIEGRVQVNDFEGFMWEITVRGPSFRQVYTTDLDGRFRFWVPKGKHVLSVLDGKSVGLNLMRRELSYAASSTNKPIVVPVHSGTRGVVIKD